LGTSLTISLTTIFSTGTSTTLITSFGGSGAAVIFAGGGVSFNATLGDTE
jgi:hypothetical protein